MTESRAPPPTTDGGAPFVLLHHSGCRRLLRVPGGNCSDTPRPHVRPAPDGTADRRPRRDPTTASTVTPSAPSRAQRPGTGGAQRNTRCPSRGRRRDCTWRRDPAGVTLVQAHGPRRSGRASRTGTGALEVDPAARPLELDASPCPAAADPAFLSPAGTPSAHRGATASPPGPLAADLRPSIRLEPGPRPAYRTRAVRSVGS